MASNVPFSFDVVDQRVVTGSPGPRRHPFGFGQEPVSGQLSGSALVEDQLVYRFPVAFRRPAFASWAILFPLGT
jgi:hypothetical protein